MSQKIIIIGASSGIGRQLASLYAQRGDTVGITGRRGELLEELRQQFPEQIITSAYDVTGADNISRLTALIEQLGGLDLLIISAGTGEPSEELKWHIDQSIVATNVNAFVEMANYTYTYFVKQGHGQLAGISSVAANRGSSYSPAYAASKAFESTYLEGLSLKAQKFKKNVFVTCIEPGFVKTRMAKGGDKMFWVVPVEKAALQIMRAIDRRKRKVYVSRRWKLIARLMKYAPYWLFKKAG